MRDIKKLFRRDRLYWLLMIVGMGVLLTYFLVPFIPDFTGYVQWTLEIFTEHPEWSIKLGDAIVIDVFGVDSFEEGTMEILLMGILMVALLAQTVKILFQETKNRAEVLNVFPIRKRRMLTYHYISGLFLTGLPILVSWIIVRLQLMHMEKTMHIIIRDEGGFWSYAVRIIILFMLQYALLQLSGKVANHVPGTIFTFVIADYAMILLADYCFGVDIFNMLDDCMGNWVLKAVVAVVLIVLSYLTDWKKDYARNGFYAFPIVHWIMMASVLGELCFIFYHSYDSLPRAVAYVLSFLSSVLLTAGVHYLTKAKSI